MVKLEMNNMRLAIIGTAGRQEDASKLTVKHWNAMCLTTVSFVQEHSATSFVSGGAAWADHVAVRVAQRLGMPVRIWLPKQERDLEIAKYYHSRFSMSLKRDTWAEVLECQDINYHGGFKDRNTNVAIDAQSFIAMTFGDRGKVKDGGTADTVKKMLQRGLSGWHFDLNSLELHPATL